jgi:hypothetical protein
MRDENSCDISTCGARVVQGAGGVDTHGLTHHAAVIDGIGRHLDDRGFPATIRSYRDLLNWIRLYRTLASSGQVGDFRRSLW